MNRARWAVLLVTLLPSVAAADTLQVSRVASGTWQGDFTKYIYGFPLSSEQGNLGSISGTVSIGDDAAGVMDQMLWVVGVVRDKCPSTSGETYTSYAALDAAYPDRYSLYTINVKVDTSKTQTLSFPLNVTFTQPLPIRMSAGGCLFVMMDAGAGLGTTTAATNVTLQYDTNVPPNPGPATPGMGGEICFNSPSGCEAAAPAAGVFVKDIPVNPSNLPGDVFRLIDIHGSHSAASLTAGGGGFTIVNDYYVDPTQACVRNYAINGPYSSYAPPAQWIKLYSQTVSGQAGWDYDDTLVSQAFPGFTLPKNACFHWVSSMSGSSAVDMESQLDAEIVPVGVDIGLRLRQGGAIVRLAAQTAGATPASPLRVTEGGTQHAVALVDPSDPLASKLRIQTSGGLKALSLLP